jgi:imidazolonepropionase-like amidohydrolase
MTAPRVLNRTFYFLTRRKRRAGVFNFCRVHRQVIPPGMLKRPFAPGPAAAMSKVMTMMIRAARHMAMVAGTACAVTVACPAAAQSEVTIVRAETMYLSPTSPPVQGAVIELRDGRIAGFRRQPAEGLEGHEETACNGGVVVAGFQNSHVHFTGEDFADAGAKSPDALTASLQTMLTRYGFTTVFDTASALDNTAQLRLRIERGDIAGPRILTTGAGIYPHNGLPFYLADLPATVRERLPQPENAEAAERIARENLLAGADATKLFVATPQADGSVRRMSEEVIEAAAKATHGRNRLVVVHPTDAEGIRAALDARANVLLHTTPQEQEPWSDSLLRQMKRADVALVPTLQLWGFEAKKSSASEEQTRKFIQNAVRQLREFHQAGSPVLFGTDVGYMTEFDPTTEYRLMSQAGMKPLEILASLTTSPAERWNESTRRGRLEIGMDADLVVLAGDPANDVTHFANVKCTIRGGKVIYKRD